MLVEGRRYLGEPLFSTHHVGPEVSMFKIQHTLNNPVFFSSQTYILETFSVAAKVIFFILLYGNDSLLKLIPVGGHSFPIISSSRKCYKLPP